MALPNYMYLKIGSLRSRSILGLSACIISVATPRLSHAQISFGSAFGDMFSKMLNQAMSHRMVVNPSLVTVDPNTKAITIELSNPTKDTLEAELSVGLSAPTAFGGGGPKPKSPEKRVGELLADEPADSAEVAAKPDSILPSASLAGWIKGLPERIKLAPGEKKSITAKLVIPGDAKHGEYAAWIIAGVHPSKQPTTDGESSMSWKIGDGNTLNESGAKVVYKIEQNK